MSRTANTRTTTGTTTFNGAPTSTLLTAEAELRRAVLTCLLWEKEFYRSGHDTAKRIRELAAALPIDTVAALAAEARTKYKLRHVPLWLIVGMFDSPAYKGSNTGIYSKLSDIIPLVVQRPDEMAELVSLYWKDGKKPLPNQMKKGLAKAFGKFNEYSLAKFDKPGAISLRDVMFLCHPNPSTVDCDRNNTYGLDLDRVIAAKTEMYKRIANKQMVTPDTWETQLSSGADKKATWIRLIGEQKLGAQALLMNLRNMVEAGVHADVIRTALVNANVERVLPFQFITAARHAKQFEPELETLMFKCLEDSGPKLRGQTTLLIDKSGSMGDKISSKGELTRYDAAAGLAMLLREQCEHVRVFTFDSSGAEEVAPRRGFALRDALGTPRGGTMLGLAVSQCPPADRTIVLTDEQSSDSVGGPKGKGYMINVATYEYSVGYGPWCRVAGWSEAIVDFIKAQEAL